MFSASWHSACCVAVRSLGVLLCDDDHVVSVVANSLFLRSFFLFLGVLCHDHHDLCFVTRCFIFLLESHFVCAFDGYYVPVPCVCTVCVCLQSSCPDLPFSLYFVDVQFVADDALLVDTFMCPLLNFDNARGHCLIVLYLLQM